MNKENQHSEQFLKEITGNKNSFTTPENYFDNLSERIATQQFQESLPKNSGFKVPNNYFETFSVQKPKSKVRLLTPYIAIAAAVVIGFFTFKPNTNTYDELNNSDIINYLAIEESIDINEIINNTEDSDLSFMYSNINDLNPTIDQVSLELSEFDIIDF
ncbi:hypothetical protein [Wenyingzhuangia aestuarii]|uniref:hypothetical protein n=1 Tax=Wenyingzhuangia aestuarii TaxID=1647582 RepID=UPI001438D9F3|nr:hypothetical protein [Wenyingzhuangia aestuarii]NJB83814.1 hypothetical protein [Wenyingzhuangia aestuarii]